jgi:predicted transposase YbfD/YdcC
MFSISDSFLKHFENLEDPRVKNNHNKRHSLTDILVLTILAIICGAESWVDIEEFCDAKEDWFKTFLELPNGIPSHDTFGHFFSRLSPTVFQESFLSWISTLAEISDGEIVAIDGKTLRGSYDTARNRKAIHMVSAWANSNRLILGQIKTNEKSNEITAIPELLKMIEIKGTTITIDAMGTQKEIAELIIAREADYVLALKGNQGIAHMMVEDYFKTAMHKDFLNIEHEYYEEVEKGHGRIEVRRCWMISNLDWLYDRVFWKELKSVGMVQSTRIIKGKETTETRFFLISFAQDVKKFAMAVRKHWEVEALHWYLDVGFNEDDCRVRKGNAAENFSILRRIALNLLNQEKTRKIGIKTKRKRCGWDHKYLLKVLSLGLKD